MSTRGIVARGKPAYDDATEIYGRSAHPSGLAPGRLIFEQALRELRSQVDAACGRRRKPVGVRPPVCLRCSGHARRATSVRLWRRLA